MYVAEKKAKRVQWTPELAVAALEQLILNAEAKTVSVVYVQKKMNGLFKFLHKNFRDEDDEFRWSFVFAKLSQEARSKIYVNLSIESAVEEFMLLIANSSRAVTSEYVAKSCWYLYDFLCENFKNISEKLDNSCLKEKLFSSLQNKSARLPNDMRKRIISKLDILLYLADEDYVMPFIFRSKYTSFHASLMENFPDGHNGVDWHAINQSIDCDLRNKLKYCRTKVSALKELNDLLREKKPARINSRYIKNLNSNLFNFLRMNFRDAKDFIDWHLIVSQLDAELQLKFSYPIRSDRRLPENTYEDSNEIEMNFGENRKYLYTFLHASRLDEFEKRNELCLSLIDLARRGNKTAELQLTGLMCFLAEKWTNNLRAFGVFRYYGDKRQDVIRRCIYNYRNGGPFVGYVYKSLQGTALGLSRMHEVDFELGSGRLF